MNERNVDSKAAFQFVGNIVPEAALEQRGQMFRRAQKIQLDTDCKRIVAARRYRKTSLRLTVGEFLVIEIHPVLDCLHR